MTQALRQLFKSVVFLCAAVTVVSGQSEKLAVNLVVIDRHDFPIANARAKLISLERVLEAQGDTAGSLRFDGVVPESYDLQVFANGFATKVYKNLHVPISDSMPFEVVLEMGSPFNECVVVNTATYKALTLKAKILSGRVVDQDSGRGVKHANLTLINAITGLEIASFASDQHGTFGFASLPPGRYSAWATKAGYRPDEVKDFLVPRGNQTLLSFKIDIQKHLHVCQ